jgi:hypothetical protein
VSVSQVKHWLHTPDLDIFHQYSLPGYQEDEAESWKGPCKGQSTNEPWSQPRPHTCQQCWNQKPMSPWDQCVIRQPRDPYEYVVWIYTAPSGFNSIKDLSDEEDPKLSALSKLISRLNIIPNKFCRINLTERTNGWISQENFRGGGDKGT